MKIICDSCRTKYSISDDKVRGKVIKLRCKKCQNMIVVKGTDGTAEGGQIEGGSDDAGGGKPTMLTASDPAMEAMDALENEVGGRAPARTMISGGGDWHLVLNEQQTGPFTPEEVEQKFRSGEINANTFIWKEGFSDWIPISSVPEFAHLAAGAPAGVDNEATNLYNANNPPKPQSADPFGAAPQSGADDLFGGGAKPAAAPAADPFGQEDPFGQDAPAGGAAKPPLPSMTGARSESSVLFSLTNLQALALGSKDAKAPATPQKAPPSATSNTEGSGLIDIRSMSSALQFSKEKDKKDASQDVLQFSGDSAAAFAPSMASGVMLPMEPKSNTGVILGSVIGGVVALAGVVVLVLFLTGNLGGEKTPPPPPQIIVQAPANPTPNGTTPNNTVAVAPTPTPTENPAATPTPTPTPTPTATPDPKKDPKVAPDPKKDPKTAAPTATPKEPAKPETPTATPTPEPKPEPKPTGQHKDELDDLLGGKSSGGGAESSGPAQLSSTQINGVMSKANFGPCKTIGTGKVQMKVTINSSGSVTGATGDGSPLATCVAGIVRKLKFPSISSPSQTFPYPVYVKE